MYNLYGVCICELPLFMILPERIYNWLFKSQNTTAGVSVNNACSAQVKYSSVAWCLWGGRGRIFSVCCYAVYSSAFQSATLFSLLFIWEQKCSNICTDIGACKLSLQPCEGGYVSGSRDRYCSTVQFNFGTFWRAIYLVQKGNVCWWDLSLKWFLSLSLRNQTLSTSLGPLNRESVTAHEYNMNTTEDKQVSASIYNAVQ